MPKSAGGQDTSSSFGGLAYRYVNGNLQFLTTANVQMAGWSMKPTIPALASARNPSNLPQAKLVNYWGDVYTGHKWVGNGGGAAWESG